MGLIAKALSQQSSSAAKKADLWPELMAKLGECVTQAHVDDFEAHLVAIELQIPRAWHEPLAEVIEKTREEIAADDIGAIMRSKYDF
jgi:hypothetical protein